MAQFKIVIRKHNILSDGKLKHNTTDQHEAEDGLMKQEA